MDFSWMLLSLFLVAILLGIVKSLSKSILKNSLRLAGVVIAFAITLLLQINGVFQGILESIVSALNLVALLPGFESAIGLIVAIASTIISPIFFVIVFFVIRLVLNIIIYFVVKIVEKNQEKKAEKLANAVEVAAAPEVEKVHETVENSETTEIVVEENTEAVAEETPVAAVVEEAPVAAVVEETPAKVEKPKKKKKKKGALYPECAWKRVVSIATGAISGLLVLSIILMPIFYLMGILTDASDALDESDATDSQIYQIVEVIDEYVLENYSESFVIQLYGALGIDELMQYTATQGGKIVLESGEVVYANDVLKNILANGLRIAAQITSAESEYLTIKDDLDAILSDPMIASLAAELIMTAIENVELTTPEDGDIMGNIVNDFVLHYQNADKATISNDLKALGSALGVLAEKGIILELIAGNTDFEVMLEDRETLRSVVKAISGLSAFGPTIENAFELGVDILGETLEIPANSEEAYGILIANLLDATNSEATSAKYNYSEVELFVKQCIKNGKKTTNSTNKKHSGYDDYVAYLARWKAVQSAFGHSSEDRSYGAFTIELDGKLYILTSKNYIVEVPAAPGANATEKEISDYNSNYGKRISPVADLVHYIARNSSSNMTESSLKSLLGGYTSTNAAGKELALMIVNEDYSKLDAVTVEKMLAATNFNDWTDEEKAKDSELCIDIIMNLLDMMEMLDSGADTSDITSMLGQFELLGETMDLMRETSCISDLAPLLLEGLVSNEMFSQYLPTYVAYDYNDLVASGQVTYTEIMKDLASTVKTLLQGFGGAIN